MPHIVVEYSAEVDARFDVTELMEALHTTAASTGVMLAADIKVNALSYADYLGAGKRDSFCHVSVCLRQADFLLMAKAFDGATLTLPARTPEAITEPAVRWSDWVP